MQMFGVFFQHESSFPTITITNNSFFFYYCPINLCNLPSIKKLNFGKPMNNTKTIKTP